VSGFLHDGGEIATAGDLEVAEDEEFVEGGGLVEDGMIEAFGGQSQRDGGFKVGADLLFLAGFFDGLLDDPTDLEKFIHRERGIAAGEGWIGLREDFHVHAVGVAEVLPGFVRREGEHGGEEAAQGLGDLADGGLRGEAARAGGGIAVHPVLGDVDVEGAEVAGDEAVDDAEDLPEIIVRVGVHTLLGHDVEALQDPAVHEGVL